MKFNFNNYFKKRSNLRPLIVAEISANHCGEKKIFLDTIKSAAKNGADLIKIQTYEAKDISINKVFNFGNNKKNIWKLYKKAQTPFSWHNDAFKLAKKLKIELFSTPFSIRAVDLLKKYNTKIYKISSFEITDFKLVDKIAKTKKPVIVSTGMASLQEIEACVKIINKYHKKIILLHCVSGYPTPEAQTNLRRLNIIKKKFPLYNIGLSDHTNDILTSLASIPFGVTIIEKHFMIRKNLNSLDKKFSILPKELLELSEKSKRIYSALGKESFSIQKKEKISKYYRRSIYTVKEIKKNEKITKQNIGTFRPHVGLPASNYFKILGKKTKKNIKAFSPIFNKDII